MDSSVTIAALLRIARSWLGTPFGHQGRLKGVRVDCSGLVLESCREAGLLELMGLQQDYDFAALGYSRYSEGWRLHEGLIAVLPTYPPMEARPGDIATFRDQAGYPSHCGLIGDAGSPLSLIHAYAAWVGSRARVQEHRLLGIWRRQLHAVYRLPLQEYPAWPD